MDTDEGRPVQKIVVFQQNSSGESKIEGIRRHGGNEFAVEVISIDDSLPQIVDEPGRYLPRQIDADLVLDFLKHPDLSYHLALACRERRIPVIARGKRWRTEGVLTPPT